MPGPAVDVIARAPAQPAPMTIPIDAISSSACTIANVAFPEVLSTRYFFMYPISVSGNDDEGVIGYQATTVTPAIMEPSAAAALGWGGEIMPPPFFLLRPNRNTALR